MCGIVGAIGGRFDRNTKVQMLKKLQHRGPDGEGLWESDDNLVWLGHRRLSIIDPEGGLQPLSNEDQSIWITFNGCIYNYLELAQSLRQRGHKFRTYSDTEVIVHAYEEYGEDCLKYFVGMFSFVIWDERKKKMFCARDRIGVKPFYYFLNGDRFVFASEIKALFASGLVPKSPNPYAIQEYLVFQTTLQENTLFKDVYKLLPGHHMTVEYNGASIKSVITKYWDLGFDIDFMHTEEYFVDRLRVLLDDAVKIRLRSDVSLGAHLSGGLDSSTVVSLASMMNSTDGKIKTFTGAFDEGDKFDETRYARLVAHNTGSEYLNIYPTERDFIDTLPKIMFYMDEPAAGPGVFPQFMVSQLAAQHVKVVLGGQGGDEIFAGYTRYLVGYLEECLKGSIEGTEKTGEYAATLASIIPNLPMLKQYIPMLKSFWKNGLFESQDRRYFRLMNRSSDVEGLYHSDFRINQERIFDSFSNIFLGSNAESFLNRMLYFDMKVHLPALLHVEDRVSMAWGLESRVPLLDHRIVEFMASVPPTIKFKNGEPKHLFRKAIRNLIPEEVLNRQDKMGFPVPLHKWYKTSISGFVKEVLLDQRARERGLYNIAELEKKIDNENDFGRSVWGALNLELWYKTFIDQ